MALAGGAGDEDNVLRLARPPNFTGLEADWTEWSFVMRSYLAMQSTEMGTLIEAAEHAGAPLISMAH